MLCCLYFGVAYDISSAAFRSSFIASDPHYSLAKQCSRGETDSAFSALFLISAQSYITYIHYSKSHCAEGKTYTFKFITSCLHSLFCICSYLPQLSKQGPAFSAVSWKHNLSANYLRNYCTWAGYNGLRNIEKFKGGRGVSINKQRDNIDRRVI